MFRNTGVCLVFPRVKCRAFAGFQGFFLEHISVKSKTKCRGSGLSLPDERSEKMVSLLINMAFY
jgi:hypothetical protein